MARRSSLLVLLVGWLVIAVGALPAQVQRVALVEGNGAYQAAPRRVNPVPDANAVARVLTGHGFRVPRAGHRAAARPRAT